MAHALADGILTQAEETLLREFRDRFALANADRTTTAQLARAHRDRLMINLAVNLAPM